MCQIAHYQVNIPTNLQTTIASYYNISQQNLYKTWVIPQRCLKAFGLQLKFEDVNSSLYVFDDLECSIHTSVPIIEREWRNW